ncbi:hypothetical protein Y1Q_0016557 [Alligator mississippiensis]|uniref:Uncharacterized protein n=1 Tax=Alligator mississippiensis TaxID=8496 RepID=A0A151N397_ALLMI|nr:hypothetical protein Y1Q_0016557 [Alligator mississippiensis]
MCVPQDLYTATRLDFIVLGCNPVSYLSHPGTVLCEETETLHAKLLKIKFLLCREPVPGLHMTSVPFMPIELMRLPMMKFK